MNRNPIPRITGPTEQYNRGLLIMGLLDGCRNGFGDPLTPDVRSRIFLAIEEPCSFTWLKARCAIITPTQHTLWHLVEKSRIDGFTPTTAAYPPPALIIAALHHAQQYSK